MRAEEKQQVESILLSIILNKNAIRKKTKKKQEASF